jgi:hypothetical protein
MLNFILDHGKYKPDIFLNAGNALQAKQIREKIDTNMDLDPAEDDPYSVASVLIDFLTTLITPIIPKHILDDIIS